MSETLFKFYNVVQPIITSTVCKSFIYAAYTNLNMNQPILQYGIQICYELLLKHNRNICTLIVYITKHNKH